MAVINSKAVFPSRSSSHFVRVLHGTIGALIAATVAQVIVLIIGMLAWSAVVGLNGVMIATVIGVFLGAVLRGLGDWLMCSILGGAGGAVGSFFAVAAAEQWSPGTAKWAVHGGLVGMGLSCAFVVMTGIVIGAIFVLVCPRCNMPADPKSGI